MIRSFNIIFLALIRAKFEKHHLFVGKCGIYMSNSLSAFHICNFLTTLLATNFDPMRTRGTPLPGRLLAPTIKTLSNFAASAAGLVRLNCERP